MGETNLWVEVASRLADVPITVLLMLIILGGYREWWVFGSTYRSACKDRDEWKRIALDSTGLVRVASRQLPAANGGA